MKRSYNKKYFEGWYFKQTDSACNNIISIIPSVSFTKNTSRAYIQVIFQKNNDLITDICEYDISKFSTSNNPFYVQIGDSYFSKERIKVNFKGKKLIINGEVKFKYLTKLNSTFINPNIMGFFSYMPFMQCKHGILSMNHKLLGSLIINNELISFDNGIGYIEKDWGYSFPKYYTWIHCNNFEKKNTSLFFSFAKIPFLFKSFNGFICNFLLDNKQYRFATYNKSKLNIRNDNNSVNILINNKKYILKIFAKPKESKKLFAPNNGKMDIQIKEALSVYINIELKDVINNTVIYEGQSDYASIEIVN